MLEHEWTSMREPQRVIILGARGFVGHSVHQRLLQDNVNVLALTRQQVDLLADDAVEVFTALLAPEDSLVVVAAQAPCKSIDGLVNNVRMMQVVCHAIEKRPVSHLLYISSDAVYTDTDRPLTEYSVVAPDSLHGMMHAIREKMLQSVAKTIPLCFLRPSLLYGVADPHNGYGPNQFRRCAAQGQSIRLWGEGEEQRDHVFIDDVAELVRLCLWHRSRGVLNVATGTVTSFRAIAEKIRALVPEPIKIITQPRPGVMPHNGYRAFDISVCRQAFPEFRYTPLAAGLEKAMV